MHSARKDFTLAKISLCIVAVGALVYAVFHFWGSLPTGYLGQGAAATAQENLARARDLYTQGNTAEATQLLEDIAKRVRDNAVTPQALILLARLDQQAGKTAEAATLLERAYKDFPSSPDHPKAAVAYARSLEAAGKASEAVALFQQVRDSAPPELRAPALTGLGRQAELAKDLLVARDLYRQAVAEAAWNSDEWNEAVDALGRVNVALIFSPTATPESKRYTIQKRDSITSIGNALNTPQGLLTRANGIDENTTLSLGQQLKYTPKDFQIVIERSTCRLFLIDKDGIFKRYAVGLGKPGHETTLGAYKIGNKEKNPIWHKPGEGPIPFGDPRNELGTRWMPLIPEQEGLPKDLGIHGTIRPETVGKYSSNGCARLFPGEIEELYDLVVRSTPVEIVETYSGKAAGQTETPDAASARPQP